ncbi:hypothetical protein GCM10025738_22410 [Microbacterium fluvii]
MRREHPDVETRELRAAVLKERIYLTFTGLAVIVAMHAHGHIEATTALSTLAVTVFAVLLAVFVADVVAHLVAHEALPTRQQLREMVASSFGALGALALPFVFLVLAVVGVWTTDAALRASTIALIVALVAIGYAAIRRVDLTFWQRVIALGAEAALGLAVVGLQLLAHG